MLFPESDPFGLPLRKYPACADQTPLLIARAGASTPSILPHVDEKMIRPSRQFWFIRAARSHDSVAAPRR
jgi:hypothetical protein